MEIFVKESCTDTSKKFAIRVNNTNAKHLAVIVCVYTMYWFRDNLQCQ